MKPESSTVKPPSTESSTAPNQLTRRSFLGTATAAALIASVNTPLVSQEVAPRGPSLRTASFLDILRFPDSVTAYAQITDPLPLARSGSEWHGSGIDVVSEVSAHDVAITGHSPGVYVRYIHLRWNAPVVSSLQLLGDHWERSYGDLGWRNMAADRVMPWYFATFDGNACHAYGVKTGAGALCFWQLDPDGISLWLDLSNGGVGVKLAERSLLAATIVTRMGNIGEEITSGLRDFCLQMCSEPALPMQPVYGFNDWYYAYGQNTAKQILDDTDFVAGLSASNTVRPFSVIDGGWAAGPPAFPDMPQLARQIRERRVRPGIWIRPLLAQTETDTLLLLPNTRFGELKSRAQELAYDPTIPEAREKILSKVRQVVGWGFDLVKHDFSTYDLLGRWGFEMGSEPTTPGWSFRDRSQTNAEIITDLYRSIRKSCNSETIILGCNTIGHLGQGYFNIQRTGDDTSGRLWETTRRMGINTLAFRLPQHKTFFVQDADCVGITAAVPWEFNRQWMDLLARSGTALFISPGKGAREPEHAQAIHRAFELAANGGDGAEPVDQFQESTPRTWKVNEHIELSGYRELHYDWYGTEGAFPFKI